jgi:hypothetical protein
LEVPKNTNIDYRESPMAILGCGFRFPVGANRPRAFLSLLTNGVDELILIFTLPAIFRLNRKRQWIAVRFGKGPQPKVCELIRWMEPPCLPCEVDGCIP